MSLNKQALIRYHVIDDCLSNRARKYTWAELREAVNLRLAEYGYKGIGKTQIFNDINFLMNSYFEAPIVKTKFGKTSFYSYDDTNYSIRNNTLTKTEINTIENLINILKTIGGINNMDWVSELIVELEEKLEFKTITNEYISFQHNIDYVGLNFFSSILNAIQNKRVLRVVYQDFKSDLPYDIIFHPYYMKQFNNRWYVIGYNEAENNETWNLAFDRIKNIEEFKFQKFRTTMINWNDFFADFVGVTKKDEEIQKIEFIIQDVLQAKYIETNPLHETQKPLKEINGVFYTSIQVIPNYELENLLLSFGEKIKVVEPQSLVEKMKLHYQMATDLYK
jgi:predicted DNA-binding transcriptional regulator YafY